MDIPKPKVFRIRAKNLFLTYSQCIATKEAMLTHLQSKVTIKEYVIATEEHHKTLGYHLHCYISLVDKPQITDCRFFDITVDGKVCHPNIKACRKPTCVIKYCMKEDDFITNIDKLINPYIIAVSHAESGDLVSALSAVPARDIVNNYSKIKQNLATLCPHKSDGIYPLTDFTVPKLITQWIASDTHRALWVLGKSGLGKTQLIKALLPNSLFVSHMDKLKMFDPAKHQYIVFDDMSFTHFPRTAQIHLLDIENTRDINVKFGMISIPAGVRRIFLSNDWIFNVDTAIRRRLVIEVVKHQLFKDKPQAKDSMQCFKWNEALAFTAGRPDPGSSADTSNTVTTGKSMYNSGVRPNPFKRSF